tara:strand:- start:1450 stop:1815 length:366 start_codon:yes stop_codon:yes gene_type:complete
MINELMLLAACLFAVEVFIRNSFISDLKSALAIFKKIFLYIPSKRISDHWKEKAVKRYSIILLRDSVKIFFKVLYILIIFVAFSLIFDGFFEFLFLISSFIKSVLYISIFSLLRYRLLDNE